MQNKKQEFRPENLRGSSLGLFKVGETAIVQNATNGAAIYNGQECIVICELRLRKVSIGVVCEVYMVRMPNGSVLKAAEFHLRRPDPKPANTAVSWNECAWRPQQQQVMA